MNRLKLFFMVNDIKFTVFVFILTAGVVPVDIYLWLTNRRTVLNKGVPCMYDAYIYVSYYTVWLFALSMILFYIMYLHKYQMNVLNVIRKKEITKVWFDSQKNMLLEAGVFSLFITIVTGLLGYFMTGNVCNWSDAESRAYNIYNKPIDNPPLWLFILAFAIGVFALIYVSGTIMIWVWWLTNNQWIGYVMAIIVSCAENNVRSGYLTFWYRITLSLYNDDISIFKNIIFPLILCLVAYFLPVLTTKRKEFIN